MTEALLYRVERLEHNEEIQDRELDACVKVLAVHTEQIGGAGGLVKAMERLSRQVDGLHRALWAFAGSFIISAIAIAIAIASGGH